MDYVREGDTVIVWKLDRLGRNTLHVLETVKALADRGVTLVSTSDGIDSSTAAGRMMIGVAVSAGANVKAVQPMLGHAKASMTLDVYADLFDDDLDVVADQLDAAIKPTADLLRTRTTK
jgi:integrase